MGSAMLRQDHERETRPSTGEAVVFDKLRELTRSGYVPDMSSPTAGAGILLRHAAAPDLILQPDGSIDLPLDQAAKPAAHIAAKPPRMAKLRTLMIVVLAVCLWFLSVVITVSILEGM
ncbi:MAG TPA: hypothetical protein VFO69_02950 [Allosphingosinicella sp.]|nr:hypothetical protein [Allosphingosinicella sp.]